MKVVSELEAASSQDFDVSNQSILDDGTDTESSSLAQPVNKDKENPNEGVLRLDTSQSSTSSDTQETQHTQDTQHTQRNWLENLKLNFNEMIIQKCSVNTRNAVENNKELLVGVRNTNA